MSRNNSFKNKDLREALKVNTEVEAQNEAAAAVDLAGDSMPTDAHAIASCPSTGAALRPPRQRLPGSRCRASVRS
jgi:hypothetical protein